MDHWYDISFENDFSYVSHSAFLHIDLLCLI